MAGASGLTITAGGDINDIGVGTIVTGTNPITITSDTNVVLDNDNDFKGVVSANSGGLITLNDINDIETGAIGANAAANTIEITATDFTIGANFGGAAENDNATFKFDGVLGLGALGMNPPATDVQISQAETANMRLTNLTFDNSEFVDQDIIVGDLVNQNTNTISGTISLLASGDFTTLAAGSNIQLDNNLTINAAAGAELTGGTLTLLNDKNLTVEVSAANDGLDAIDFSAGIIDIGSGDLSLTAANDNIFVNNVANIFAGDVSVVSDTTNPGHAVELVSTTGFNIASITMNDANDDALTITAGGNLTQSGLIRTGTGAVTITTNGAGGDITLDRFDNEFNGELLVSQSGANFSTAITNSTRLVIDTPVMTVLAPLFSKPLLFFLQVPVVFL